MLAAFVIIIVCLIFRFLKGSQVTRFLTFSTLKPLAAIKTVILAFRQINLATTTMAAGIFSHAPIDITHRSRHHPQPHITHILASGFLHSEAFPDTADDITRYPRNY